MPVSYEQAVATIRQATEPRWTRGTYCLDDRKITETDEYYAFTIGPREFIVDGDESYVIDGAPYLVVYKETGEVGWLHPPEVWKDPGLRERPNPHATFSADSGRERK